jgi:hypothetical protein
MQVLFRRQKYSKMLIVVAILFNLFMTNTKWRSLCAFSRRLLQIEFIGVSVKTLKKVV